MTSSSLDTRRNERRHSSRPSNDPRSAGARDRDRILYSEPFRRLVGVTQVVGAHEGTVFHNRLTHSIKVGQIARRLAEKILHEHKDSDSIKELEALGGLDPEVAEAAALAHDIGHPPFGHTGEAILNGLVFSHGCPDGFEGNAQSFRIITKLAFRKPNPDKPLGLDLSRATLRATLKYPWLRKLGDEARSKKWGAYDTEEDELKFAMQLKSVDEDEKSLEASIMDWADDITYAVHDMEDFYRAGLIPLPTLASTPKEYEDIFEKAAQKCSVFGINVDTDEVIGTFDRFRGLMPPTQFVGNPSQIGRVLSLRSNLIDKLINAFTVNADSNKIDIDQEARITAEILKAMTRRFVITSPDLESQRFGYRRIITQIFEAFCDSETAKEKDINREYLKAPFFNRQIFEDCEPARRTADYIASLSEAQAMQLYGRITGHTLGSVRDLIV